MRNLQDDEIWLGVRHDGHRCDPHEPDNCAGHGAADCGVVPGDSPSLRLLTRGAKADNDVPGQHGEHNYDKAGKQQLQPSNPAYIGQDADRYEHGHPRNNAPHAGPHDKI
jgi:hypothetical protein